MPIVVPCEREIERQHGWIVTEYDSIGQEIAVITRSQEGDFWHDVYLSLGYAVEAIAASGGTLASMHYSLGCLREGSFGPQETGLTCAAE
jgi:hypothetical protein